MAANAALSECKEGAVSHDRIVNQHQPAVALYPRNLSYDLLPLIGPPGWALLRALHDHADEQAVQYRGARPIAPSAEEMQALAGVGEASLLVIKELLRHCGCLSWEDARGKQEPRPGRSLKQAPTRSTLYYLHPLTGLDVTPQLVDRVFHYVVGAERAQAYLKANGILRARPAYLPSSVWPVILPWMVEDLRWQELFQRVHGQGAHVRYRVEAARWLESAAEVVATLEWEQQPLHKRDELPVRDRALMVMERWGALQSVASWRRNGSAAKSHGESRVSPRTPVKKLTNQSTNEPSASSPWGVQPGGEGGGRERGRQEYPEEGERNGAVATKADEPRLRSGADPIQAEAGTDAEAQAEAVLWASVPIVLRRAEAVGVGGATAAVGMQQTLIAHPLPAYQPTRSERRQARRLLHTYPVDAMLAALHRVVESYCPEPGQPAQISRFGFAVGLPGFRAALLNPAPDEISPIVRGELPHLPTTSEDDALQQDFWHEYERVNGRAATRAERRRVEALTGRAEWRQLLIWLDRWERAHQGGDAEVGPGYFEACADDKTKASVVYPPPEARRSMVRGTRRAREDDSDTPARLSETQQHAYARMTGLGIRAARLLAQLPTTTPELVEAWWRVAHERTEVKDKCAYVASGVGSGEPPHAVSMSRTGAVLPPAPPSAIEPAALSAPNASAEAWAAILDLLKARLSGPEFETWIRPCRLLELGEQGAVIGVPNVFVRQELEQRYRGLIDTAVEAALGYHAKPLFVIH